MRSCQLKMAQIHLESDTKMPTIHTCFYNDALSVEDSCYC